MVLGVEVAHMHYLVASVIAVAVFHCINFAVHRGWTFKR